MIQISEGGAGPSRPPKLPAAGKNFENSTYSTSRPPGVSANSWKSPPKVEKVSVDPPPPKLSGEFPAGLSAVYPSHHRVTWPIKWMAYAQRAPFHISCLVATTLRLPYCHSSNKLQIQAAPYLYIVCSHYCTFVIISRFVVISLDL